MLFFELAVLGLLFIVLAAAWKHIPRAAQVIGDLVIAVLVLIILVPGAGDLGSTIGGYTSAMREADERTRETNFRQYIDYLSAERLSAEAAALRPVSSSSRAAAPRPIGRAQQKARADEIARDVCRANHGTDCEKVQAKVEPPPQ